MHYPIFREQGFVFNTTPTSQSFAAASGVKTLVAAQGASKKVLITSFILTTDKDTVYTFEDDAGNTVGIPIPMAANTQAGMSYLPEPLFLSAANKGWAIRSSAAVTGGCLITYRIWDGTTSP